MRRAVLGGPGRVSTTIGEGSTAFQGKTVW
jgi:hypothetical protein